MKFHKRTRYPYWSNTKLFSWMLPEESKKPFAFEKLKEQLDSGINPTPLVERVIDKLQDIVMFPSDLIYSIRIYFKNSKGNTHVLDGGLEKGQWYDITYRIPQCLFHELEKFIEVEKGLDVHEWEKTLVFNEDWGVKPDDERYGKLTHQALAAIEQDAIYQWWKINKDEDYKGREEEDKFQAKEEEMLIRLIKIRGSLWT
jgi:hypothetical protein